MTVAGPRFLDEDPSPARQSGIAVHTEPPPVERLDRLVGPVLLAAEPDAPAELQHTWKPRDLAASSASVTSLHWTALGIAVVLVSLAVFSAIGFVLGLGERSVFLGAASGLGLSLGVGLIGYGLAGEWRGYRKLKTVDRVRLPIGAVLPGLFLRLGREQQRIALAPTRIRCVRCLGFRNIFCEDGDHAHAAPVGGHHNAQGLILAYAKFGFQNRDDERTGRKIVIDQHDFMEARAFDLYLILDGGFSDDVGHRWHRSAWIVLEPG